MIRLFLSGDFVPKGLAPQMFRENARAIFRAIKPSIRSADFSIINLEAPVMNNTPSPIKKSGPCLGIESSTVEVLSDVGFNIATLANNHFFDQGQPGVNNTVEACERNGILTVGGGATIEIARRPLMLEHDGKKVAIINACEHEFSIANLEHGGSNPLDLINMQEDIANVKNKADYVVLLLHGGIEQYHYPTPRMKRWYHHFVDLGVDAVINHHQHCINGYEVYRGKPIFYGLGNFYFPMGNELRPKSWQYGYAVQLMLNKKIDFELIPYKQTADGITLRNKDEFEREIGKYNQPLEDDSLLQQIFDEYIMQKGDALKMDFLPSFMRNRLSLALARRGYLGKIYKGKQLYAIKNKLCCESHNESLSQLFSILINQ